MIFRTANATGSLRIACALFAAAFASGSARAQSDENETTETETESDPDAVWAQSVPLPEAGAAETDGILMAPSFQLGRIRATEPRFPPFRTDLETSSYFFGIGLRFPFLDLSPDLALAASLSAEIAYPGGAALREGQVNSRVDIWPRVEISYAAPRWNWAGVEAAASLGAASDRLQYSFGHVNAWMPKASVAAALVSTASFWEGRLRPRLAAGVDAWGLFARYFTDQPEAQAPSLSPDLAAQSFAAKGSMWGSRLSLEPGLRLRASGGSEHTLGLRLGWEHSRYSKLRVLDSLVDGRSQSDVLVREASVSLRWERIR